MGKYALTLQTALRRPNGKGYIQQPLENFINHVDEYTKCRQSVKRGGIRELNDALEAFDGLSSQIEKLRIDLYEEKLVLAQTEMEYMQLQIKPHFFVNCFSLIHAMAQKQEYIAAIFPWREKSRQTGSGSPSRRWPRWR